MPRVDFYRLTRDPVERVLPALATRILTNGDRLLVVAASAMQRQAIDEALWTLNRASTLAAREDVDNRYWKQDENGRWSEGP